MGTSQVSQQNTETPFRILIDDDVPANLDVLRQVLEAEGYQVHLAPNGRWRCATPRVSAPS
jgi:CheY-like chemotaxis protein